MALSALPPLLRQSESVSRLRAIHARIAFRRQAEEGACDLRQTVGAREEERTGHSFAREDADRISGSDEFRGVRCSAELGGRARYFRTPARKSPLPPHRNFFAAQPSSCVPI